MNRLRVCALILLLQGCVTHKVPIAPDAAPGPQARVSGELLVDANTPAVAPPSDEVHETPVQLAGNRNPVYPPDLVAQQLPPQQISVRVVVDETGRVQRVESLDPDAEQPPRSAFLVAVRTALLSWRFEPFRVIHWLPGPDRDGDGESDGEVVGGSTTRPFRFDMRFRFELVDGVAKVSS